MQIPVEIRKPKLRNSDNQILFFILIFFLFPHCTSALGTRLRSIFRFTVGDLSDSESDLSSEPAVKEVEFQGTEETHRAFSHGTELIPW